MIIDYIALAAGVCSIAVLMWIAQPWKDEFQHQK